MLGCAALMLVDGTWVDTGIPRTPAGEFQRQLAQFRSWITPDGAPGPTGEGGFAAASGRYHLYAYIGCPWAQRALIFRTLKGLEPLVDVSYAHSMGRQGWMFEPGSDCCDQLFDARFVHQIYTKAAPHYTGTTTVPVLWDTQHETIVSNESADIIRMFNTAFDELTDNRRDYYPERLRAEIDAINDRVYRCVNNGVYRVGFAATQAIYDAAIDELFETLDMLDARLGTQRYLVGDELTEADWRLFPTLIRFDVAYYSAFRCNIKRLVDYPNLWAYARALYQMPGIAETVDLDVYRHGYHSITGLARVVPRGPSLDLDAAHGR